MLEVVDVVKDFGGLRAVDHVSFRVNRGEIKALIGPNGAGKTTLLKVINGLLSPTSGEIRYAGKKISKMRPHSRCELGIGSVFQLSQLFRELSVLENAMIGMHCHTKSNIITSGLRLPVCTREEKASRDKCRDILRIVGLEERASVQAGILPIGQQRLLEIARALATDARFLLLDEPAAGLNSAEKEQLGRVILGIRERGTDVLLVEHDMELVMDISDSIVVLDYGKVIAEGPPESVRTNKAVIAAYLGE